MQTFKSKLFNLLIVKSHLFRGQLKKEVFDENTSIQEFRDRCEKGATRFGKLPEGITVVSRKIDDIYSEWLVPIGAVDEKVILYFHGGGYVSGSCSDHRNIVSKIAKLTGFRILLFEYRLAPEHPFPAAVNDSITVYKSLLSDGFGSENILFAGESAGGGLCLATLLAIKEAGLPQPAAAVAISPWTDLACSSESYHTKNKVSPAPIDSWKVFSRYYIGDNIATNPLISPLYGDLTELPPIFINSGVNDELYEDGLKFYLKAKEQGVEITFKAGEGMIHCYPLLAPMFKEATDAMNEIVDFIKLMLKCGVQRPQ